MPYAFIFICCFFSATSFAEPCHADVDVAIRTRWKLRACTRRCVGTFLGATEAARDGRKGIRVKLSFFMSSRRASLQGYDGTLSCSGRAHSMAAPRTSALSLEAAKSLQLFGVYVTALVFWKLPSVAGLEVNCFKLARKLTLRPGPGNRVPAASFL